MKYHLFNKNYAKRQQKSTQYSRFILIGADNNDAVALFTNNIDETKVLLQYFPHLAPGSPVFILNPRLRGYVNNSNTPLIQSSMPLIPMDSDAITTNTLLPRQITENEDYSWFNFQTKTLEIANAVFLKNVCGGIVCDATGDKTSPCGCIVASSKGVTLQADLNCEQLQDVRVDVPLVKFRSGRFANFLIASPCDVMALDPFDVDDTVRQFVAAQNESTGFWVTGWCRAPKEQDDLISDARVMHVVDVRPVDAFTETALAARFRATASTSTLTLTEVVNNQRNNEPNDLATTNHQPQENTSASTLNRVANPQDNEPNNQAANSQEPQ